MKNDSTAPAISIVTCTYNAATAIEITLRSVAAQDFGDFEHLIIDGNSSDSTMRIVERYRAEMAARGRRVVAISEPDGGLYFAMNKGLQLASGRFIVYINAGDRLHSADTLRRVAAAARPNSMGVVYGQTDIIDTEGRFLRHRRLKAPDELSWRSFQRGMVVCHQAFYARADIARSNPYDTSLRFSADVDWCIRVMRQCQQAGLRLKSAGCIVADFMDGGMTTANHKASLRERFNVMRRHYGLGRTVALHVWFALRSLVIGTKA